jgi:hypothetical protein
MSDGELSGFLATRPSGALCVVDDDGRLLAVPARVIDERDGVLRVELSGALGASAFAHQGEGCVVADAFETYEAIRGVITGGPVMHLAADAPRVVAVTMARTTTFSFAEARPKPAEPQPD